MFEFFRKYNKYFFWGLLIPACLALGVSYTMMQVITGRGARSAGKIFDQSISQTKLQNTRLRLRDYMRFHGSFSRELKDAQVWDHLLMLQQAKKLGFTCTAKELAKKIQEEYKQKTRISEIRKKANEYYQKFRDQFKKFKLTQDRIWNFAWKQAQKEVKKDFAFDPVKYRKLLKERNVSLLTYESVVGEKLLIDKLRNFIRKSATVAPKKIYDQYRQDYHRRQGTFLSFSPAKYLPHKEDLALSQLKKYYLSHKDLFHIPTKYTVAYMITTEQGVGLKAPQNSEITNYFEHHPKYEGKALTSAIRVEIGQVLQKQKTAQIALVNLTRMQNTWQNLPGTKSVRELAEKNHLLYGETGLLSFEEISSKLKGVLFSKKDSLFLTRLALEVEGLVSPIIKGPKGFFIYRVLKKTEDYTPRFPEIIEAVRDTMFRSNHIDEAKIKQYFEKNKQSHYKTKDKVSLEYAYTAYKDLFQNLVKKGKISGRISWKILSAYMREYFHKYLFNLSSLPVSKLDKQNLTEKLRKELKGHKIILGEKSSLKVLKKGKKWTIKDGKMAWVLVKGKFMKKPAIRVYRDGFAGFLENYSQLKDKSSALGKLGLQGGIIQKKAPKKKEPAKAPAKKEPAKTPKKTPAKKQPAKATTKKQPAKATAKKQPAKAPAKKQVVPLGVEDFAKAVKTIRQAAKNELSSLRKTLQAYYKKNPMEGHGDLDTQLSDLCKGKPVEYGRETMTQLEFFSHKILKNYSQMYKTFQQWKNGQIHPVIESDNRQGQYFIRIIRRRPSRPYDFPKIGKKAGELAKLRQRLEKDYLLNQATESAKKQAKKAREEGLSGLSWEELAKKYKVGRTTTKLLAKKKFEKMDSKTAYPSEVVQVLFNDLKYPGDISEIKVRAGDVKKGKAAQVFLVKYLYYEDPPASEFVDHEAEIKDKLLTSSSWEYLRNRVLDLKVAAFEDISEEQLRSYYALRYVRKKGDELAVPLEVLPGGSEVYTHIYQPTTTMKLRKIQWSYRDELEALAWKKAEQKGEEVWSDFQTLDKLQKLYRAKGQSFPLLQVAPPRADDYVNKVFKKDGGKVTKLSAKIQADFPLFGKQLATLKVHQLSRPLKTNRGYSLFYKEKEQKIISQVEVQKLEFPYDNVLRQKARQKALHRAQTLFDSIKKLKDPAKMLRAFDGIRRGKKKVLGALGRYRRGVDISGKKTPYTNGVRRVWRKGTKMLEGYFDGPIETAEGFYLVNVKKFEVDTKVLKARRILLKAGTEEESMAKEKAKKKAEKLLKELQKEKTALEKKYPKDGKKSFELFLQKFEKLVVKESDDPKSKRKKGDVGYFDPSLSSLDFVLKDLDFKTWQYVQKGQLWGTPIEGMEGMHLVFVTGRKGKKVKVRHLMISFSTKKRLSDEERSEIRTGLKKRLEQYRTALLAIKNLAKREAEFKNLVNKHSQAEDSEKASGGQLSKGQWMVKQDFTSKEEQEVAQEIFSFAKGGVSSVYKLEDGLAIYLVSQRQVRELASIGDIFFLKDPNTVLTKKEKSDLMAKKKQEALGHLAKLLKLPPTKVAGEMARIAKKFHLGSSNLGKISRKYPVVEIQKAVFSHVVGRVIQKPLEIKGKSFLILYPEKIAREEGEFTLRRLDISSSIEKRLSDKEREDVKKASRSRLSAHLKKLNRSLLFSDLARQFSKDATAEKGGYLEVKLPSSALSPEVEQRLYQLKKGEISQIFPEEYGYSLYLVLDKDQTTYEKNRYKIAEILLKKLNKEVE